jgi:Dinucleotide-utilizing enzymes involved in molybdopterin and thiamine biosynthesis family 2
LCSLPRITGGVIGVVPGVVGVLQASEAIKILTGIGEPLEGRLLTIDLMTMNTTFVEY